MAERGMALVALGRIACGVLAAAALAATASCNDVKRAWAELRASGEPVELPVLLSTSLPFHYPPTLFLTRTHGDVTLLLHVDSLGLVVPESTRIAEHARHTAFDSAALEGASRLVFRPARRGNRRIGHTVLFPIRFRMPEALASPRDTTGRRP